MEKIQKNAEDNKNDSVGNVIDKIGHFKCEITNKPKRPGTIDCNCHMVCMAKMSEIFLINYEGGVGFVVKNKKK